MPDVTPLPSPKRFVLFRPSDIIVGCLTIGFVFGAYSAYPELFRTTADFFIRSTIPCETPMTYRIGSVDPRFHITVPEVHDIMMQAAQVWNTAANRTLLEEDQTNGIVTVNFVYTKQEQTTQELAAVADDPSKYNAIVEDNPQQYDVGEFDFVHGSETVSIYAYDNRALLLRTAAHELGHAIRMNHVQDPNAIMYPTISGPDTQVTTADYNELIKACTGTFGNKDLQ